jgi:multiple antibiotic resistance protein
VEFVVSFLQSLALIPFTLLPLMNPLSSAPVFSATAGNNSDVISRMARQVAINCWFVLLISMLVGIYVLDIFGISLPIVRIGGGLVVAVSGWRMLLNNEQDDIHEAVAAQTVDHLSHAEIMRRSFFPITFPLTTGPGTIAACIAIGARFPGNPMLFLRGVVVAVAGATITVIIVYLCYRNAGKLLARLGDVGTNVMMRMFAFILLCIGIEIMWTGWAELNHIAA